MPVGVHVVPGAGGAGGNDVGAVGGGADAVVAHLGALNAAPGQDNAVATLFVPFQ
jgi:hypothetical protein